MSRKWPTHLVIPDCQVRPDVDTDHLRWIGNYIADKQPDVVVQIGDFNDMASLSGYAVGKAAAEGKRYHADLAAGKEGMGKLMKPVRKLHKKRRPKRMVLTLGNHEFRIEREAEAQPRFKGTLQLQDLGYEKAGWQVVPFLKIININGVDYSHYFISGAMGRPVSSAAALLRVRQGSATMGHVQNVEMAIHPRTQKTALFCGVCYLHDEPYLTPQGNDVRRQIVMKHEVHDGVYDPMFVSLDFLKRKYS